MAEKTDMELFEQALREAMAVLATLTDEDEKRDAVSALEELVSKLQRS